MGNGETGIPFPQTPAMNVPEGQGPGLLSLPQPVGQEIKAQDTGQSEAGGSWLGLLSQATLPKAQS